jgi:hypothetical protein
MDHPHQLIWCTQRLITTIYYFIPDWKLKLSKNLNWTFESKQKILTILNFPNHVQQKKLYIKTIQSLTLFLTLLHFNAHSLVITSKPYSISLHISTVQFLNHILVIIQQYRLSLNFLLFFSSIKRSSQVINNKN